MIGAIVPLSTGRLRSRIELQARAIAHQAALLTLLYFVISIYAYAGRPCKASFISPGGPCR